MTTGTASRPSPRGLARWLFRAPIGLYRLKLGWLLGKRFMLLEHTGRVSGKARLTVLEVVRYDPDSQACVIASGWGEGSQWFRNVLRDPAVFYTVSTSRRPGQALRLDPTAAERELRDYGGRHPRALRALAKVMTGDAFDGSDDAFATLARCVPVLHVVPVTDPGNQ